MAQNINEHLDAFSLPEIRKTLKWYSETGKLLISGRLAGVDVYYVVDHNHNICSSLTPEYATRLWQIAYIEYPELISTEGKR